MSEVDKQYLKHLRNLFFTRDHTIGRNGNVNSIFGHHMRFNVANEFPLLLLSKKLHLKSIIVELLWFLRGDTNVKFLHDYNVTIWDKWVDENGDLGPVYGSQWRSWPIPDWDDERGYSTQVVDQISELIQQLKTNPHSRRHIVSAWNVGQIHMMALPPCHCLFQFYVNQRNELSLQLYQRSADWFLGVPFNIASYALLLVLIARETGYQVGEFIHTFGDTHLYADHTAAALEQLNREPQVISQINTSKVTITAPDDVNIFNLLPEHITIEGYTPLPAIKAPVSK